MALWKLQSLGLCIATVVCCIDVNLALNIGLEPHARHKVSRFTNGQFLPLQSKQYRSTNQWTLRDGAAYDDVQVNNNIRLWEPKLNLRSIRSISSKTQGLSSAHLDLHFKVNKFVLENTEDTDHVYFHWVGETTKKAKIYILAVQYHGSSGNVSGPRSQLWCSEDSGQTFHHKKFSQDASVSFMYAFPSNPEKLLLIDSTNKIIYTTADGLKTNSSHTTPVEPDILVPHPSDENKILLYSYKDQEVYASTDFAVTWTFVAKGILPGFYWGDAEFDGSPDVVHMEIEGDMPSQALYKACTIPGCLPVHTHLDQVGPFIASSLKVYKEYILIQKQTDTESDLYLMVSYKRQAFKRAQFPSNAKTSNVKLLNLDDGQVFVAVHHEDTVNLYLSDVTGQYYVHSLTDVYHEERLDWFQVDFAEVKGMNWTFMANKVDQAGHIQTYISYDKGGNWAPLYLNKSCTKAVDCALYLEVNDWYKVIPTRTQNLAPGLLFMHGQLGQPTKLQPLSVFISRDGGATWKQAPFNNTKYLQVLDQGSVLIAIPDSPSPHVVHYSLDQGDSWLNQSLDDGQLRIRTLVRPPDERSQVLGLMAVNDKEKDLTFIHLNVSSLFTRNCNDSDYELWSPKDNNAEDSTNKCILGKIIQYTRRKPKAVCASNDDNTAHLLKDKTCVCAHEDYECDFGFHSSGDTCVKSDWFDDSYLPSDCDDGGEYLKSKGYRKIPADACEESESDKAKYSPVMSPCPSSLPSGLSLATDMKTIPLGKRVTFYLEQARGSKWNTTYIWDFGEGSDVIEVLGFQNASQQEHSFSKAGEHTVKVVARNNMGEGTVSITVRAQDRLTRLSIYKPWAAVVGQDVSLFAFAMSSSLLIPSKWDTIHYMWSFGDEGEGSRPLLSWNASQTHTYSEPGSYTVSVEAANSVSSVEEEVPIKIFASAVVLKLRFEDNDGWSRRTNPLISSFITQSLCQQITQDLGISKNRVEAALIRSQPEALLYIFPHEEEEDMSDSEIKTEIINQTNQGLLGFNLFGSSRSSGSLLKIVSAVEVSAPNVPTDVPGKKGPNLMPVYIAVPVLLVLLVGCLVLLIVYCQRKKTDGSGGRYSLFPASDDLDTMLDDSDVSPLSLGFETAHGGGDDSLIDSGTGGNCLVMETGDLSDDAVIC